MAVFVYKQNEEVMMEIVGSATLSSSPGLRGRDEQHLWHPAQQPEDHETQHYGVW